MGAADQDPVVACVRRGLKGEVVGPSSAVDAINYPIKTIYVDEGDAIFVSIEDPSIQCVMNKPDGQRLKFDELEKYGYYGTKTTGVGGEQVLVRGLAIFPPKRNPPRSEPKPPTKFVPH
jgi:hypothetical protein